MKNALTQLVITLAAIGIVGCGSENSGTIVTPTGQTISASPSTQPSTPNTTANKPQPATTAPDSTSDTTTTNTSTSPQTTPTTNNYKDLVAILEATGGFMKYGSVAMMDYDETDDGTVTIVFNVTSDLSGSGNATFMTQYVYTTSDDGKIATMKPIHNKIEMKNFKYDSKCLGEVTLSGKVESDGWQLTHTDTKLYDFEHLYNTFSSPGATVSINMSGGSHSIKLNSAKISAKDKKIDNMSTTQFGTGFIYDAKEIDMSSLLQEAINAGCFDTK